MTLRGSNSLNDLAARVAEQHTAMKQAEMTAALAAMNAGFLLMQAKGECKHGQWLPFLKKAGMAERQAQRLMQLARSGLEPDTVSDLGIKGALDLISKRRLPNDGDVLIVAVGSRSELGDLEGDITAWIWHSRRAEGHIDIVSMDITGQAIALRRPVSATAENIIFLFVDRMLDERHGEMRFTTLRDDGRIVAYCEDFRDRVLRMPESAA
ncbi:MAG: DUF3102 domain-containing protein [Bosea sp.]|uniref:hypothetical protein n=1 Tax=Bosea sp. (in: a-proteobacteria) TaxID=1871050 RepID=UPI001AD3E300|nr:hypothetical protein [Bosea sp. (in: a-proteobacteria)]MBN9470658.1 DUF3102 domain-containing protein [Bosea sp. (in: a-proteobacteria)]